MAEVVTIKDLIQTRAINTPQEADTEVGTSKATTETTQMDTNKGRTIKEAIIHTNRKIIIKVATKNREPGAKLGKCMKTPMKSSKPQSKKPSTSSLTRSNLKRFSMKSRKTLEKMLKCRKRKRITNMTNRKDSLTQSQTLPKLTKVKVEKM